MILLPRRVLCWLKGHDFVPWQVYASDEEIVVRRFRCVRCHTLTP